MGVGPHSQLRERTAALKHFGSRMHMAARIGVAQPQGVDLTADSSGDRVCVEPAGPGDAAERLPDVTTSTVPHTSIRVSTPDLIAAMLHGRDKVSDLIFSPGPGAAGRNQGRAGPAAVPTGSRCSPTQQTIEIAEDLIGPNPIAAEQLEKNGSADLSYSLAGRRPVPRQRLSAALLVRDRDAGRCRCGSRRSQELGLPAQLESHRAICAMASCSSPGPTGSGKSSTLAAIVDRMNEARAIHIVTIEDPIEFLHEHKKRHDSSARAAQRHAHVQPRPAGGAAPGAEGHPGRRNARPRDDRDRARGVGDRPSGDVHAAHDRRRQDRRAHRRRVPAGRSAGHPRPACRRRSNTSFRSASLPRDDGSGRVAVLEILKSTLRTRDYVEQGESAARRCSTR